MFTRTGAVLACATSVLVVATACAHRRPPTTASQPTTTSLRTGASVLAGRVASEATSRPIRGATVMMPLLGKQAITDSAGLFVITGIPAGDQTLEVRHEGNELLATSLTFTGTDTIARLFVLSPGQLTTSASGDIDSSLTYADRYQDFRRRRARGLGRFLTREQFGKEYDRPLSEIFRYFPGVQLERNAQTNGVGIASTRQEPPLGADWGIDGWPNACYSQLFVDGVRVYSAENGRAEVSINDFRTSDLEAIEYYASPELTPPELTGAGAICGTIVLWQRIE